MKKILIIAIVCIALIGAAFVWGRMSARQAPEDTAPAITAQVVLDRIQDQYFVVTKTLFVHNTVTIALSEDTGIKKWFTEESVRAQGMMRVDIGVDLSTLTDKDIIIDTESQTVTLYIPSASILDSSLSGDLNVESTKGVWTNIKDFFSRDEGTEYNHALRELTRIAEDTARGQATLFDEAHTDAAKLLSLVVRTLAPTYTVVIK